MVGKDSLSEDQKCTLYIAGIIREDFLKQNAFSDYDYFCPLYKTIGMMKCVIAFFDKSIKVIQESTGDAKISWNLIETSMKNELFALTQLKFELPKQPREELEKKFSDLIDTIDKKFKELTLN